MKKTLLSGIMFVFFISCRLFADGVQPSGSGTEESPYNVESLDNLLWISTNNTSWSSHFIQLANINAAETQNWNNGSGFNRIGSNSIKFSGSYNGQDNSIDSLYINRPTNNYQGLFGYTNGVAIENLGVTNVNINGGDCIGGLVGINYNNSSIKRCYSSGSVNGDYQVGGLVGWNYTSSIVDSSYSTSSVSGDTYIAGLIGWNYSSTISNSCSNGNVNGSWKVGGLVGENYNSTVSNCYSISNTSATNNYVGCLIGYNDWSSFVSNCYSKGNVMGSDYVGGLTGNNKTSSTISKCYSTGNANGAGIYIGGLVGQNYFSNITDSFWDTETSGQSNSAGGTGKTSTEMKNVATFTNLTTTGLDSPWDFVSNPFDDTANDDIWEMQSNNNDGYPLLYWQDAIEITEAPSNVTTSIIGGNINISWDPVIGAISYSIYSSVNPNTDQAIWILEVSGITVTNWSEPATEMKKFYYVTALN